MHHLLLIAALLGKGPERPLGHLVIVGGGPTTPEIAERTLALAGGKDAQVLIIPFASDQPEVGQRSRSLWRRTGARHVSVLDLKDGEALDKVHKADLLWMPGGSQSRLMESLLSYRGLVTAIRDRFRQGATVGGTSAGAAVMSRIMLIAETRLNSGTETVKTGEGLGLWPEVIVDQHFVRRKRLPDLLGVVLNHPKEVGIGIDECTAVIVQGRCFEVIGRSMTYVVDARATAKSAKGSEPEARANALLYILKPGERFHLDRGVLPREERRYVSDTKSATPNKAFLSHALSK